MSSLGTTWVPSHNSVAHSIYLSDTTDILKIKRFARSDQISTPIMFLMVSLMFKDVLGIHKNCLLLLPWF